MEYKMNQTEKKAAEKTVIIIAASTAIGACIGAGLLGSGLLSNTPASIKESSYKVIDIDSIVNELNIGLPRMMDHETRFDKAIAHPNEIEYKHTLVNVSRMRIDANKFNADIRPGITLSVCEHEGNSAVSKSGVTFTYSYYDRNNVTVTKLSIPPSTCK